jgi:hypothetical protein
VWNNVKHDGVAPAAPKGPEQMKAVVTARLRRLQRLPHVIRGFFGDPELAYIPPSPDINLRAIFLSMDSA